jgi:tRNA threonylcarbamoyladenosine biosynthesis protein TsaB
MTTGVVLAIETSQREGSVALALAHGEVDHEPLRATSRHEDDLMPAIDRLCTRHGVQPRDIRGVGVSIGPGGFTGLRIAVSTTKMLAESLGASIAAVPSALVAAEALDAGVDGPVLVCLASKRDTTWCTLLERDELRHWRITGAPGIRSADGIDCSGVALVLADEYLPEAIRLRFSAARLATQPLRLSARACLSAARRMLEAGSTTDALALQPIYARPPEAVRLWKSR